ncbi:putative disease resistance protein RGA1 [Silene latifolia]|uniref:putative disease resistance protein RGA1 n=1 Tax=Silene latifolia TaxID=37657 RepID=UPI003D76C6DA
MDLATTMSIVQTILTAIQTLVQLQAICSISDCRRQLVDLQSTVETVKAVLEDADAKQDALNSQEKNYIKELKDAVYDADDVIDEFLTLAKQRKLSEAGDKVSDKVRAFLSRFKFLTHNLSNKVKKVNKKLDAIAAKSSKFSFKVENKPMRFRKEDTSSFVCDEIIGRDEDVDKIVDMILNSLVVDEPDELDVSFLAIAGMGGLGKTALAQLVFNDPRVISAFQLKNWTCIADHDQEQWNLTEILGKVVRELPGINNRDLTSLEKMHWAIKKHLAGKKYLLVLDDVWTENYDNWQQLEGFFKLGQKGSRIVVTTRSKTTAQMIGGDQVLELRGLPEMESWRLFERMAFLPKQRDEDFVIIGKEIVKRCAGSPLAIRVVGSLLRGQPKTKWQSFHNNGLANLSQSNDTMTRILKISYHQLDPSLKSCFAYCAIFPKDWNISKQMLIQLWMAQGYINLENLGEEYIFMLLQRCFFQDVRKNEFGEVEWFKMHDLFHDIAEQVAGNEICRFDYDTLNVGIGVRHLSLMYDCYTQDIFDKTLIRTFLQVKKRFSMGTANQILASKSIQKWTCLRSLDLRQTCAESLPESIGQLLHLRCLDLSGSSRLEILPKSLTKLVNLQTLDLHHCYRLGELPNDVSRLVNLSTLNVAGCNLLSRMPSAIGMLSGLHTLGQFIVCVQVSAGANRYFDGLGDLQLLNNLKGSLKIKVGALKNAKFVKEDLGEGAYLKNKGLLKKIAIEFQKQDESESKEYEQKLLEEMQPHQNLWKLKLEGYHGEKMPSWPKRGDNSGIIDLPNLVSLKIYKCQELLNLPWQIGKLPNLKKLWLVGLPNMEYLVNVDLQMPGSGEGLSFFSSLEELSIDELPKLKGWWRRSESADNGVSSKEPRLEWVSSPCFPQLTSLVIKSCLKLTYVPLCPCLENLVIYDSGRKLTWNNMKRIPHGHPSLPQHYSKPTILRINHVKWLAKMPTEFFQSLAAIVIQDEDRESNLGEVRELMQTCFLSSLRFLGIMRCPKLRSVGGWLEHLSELQYLYIIDCPNVELREIPWQHLSGSLQSLGLMRFQEMEEIPEGMQYCTSLQSLSLWNCHKLECLPEWMPKLTSLRKLQLRVCSERLKERCQQPNGEDWSLIQHIPLTCILTQSEELEDHRPDPDAWTKEDFWF